MMKNNEYLRLSMTSVDPQSGQVANCLSPTLSLHWLHDHEDWQHEESAYRRLNNHPLVLPSSREL